MGAKFGVKALSTVPIYVPTALLIDAFSRTHGVGPKLPLYDEDCQLEYFKDRLGCPDTPLYQTALFGTVTFIVCCAGSGMVIGAIYSLGKGIFKRDEPQEASNL
jgi:hypothetical protein